VTFRREPPSEARTDRVDGGARRFLAQAAPAIRRERIGDVIGIASDEIMFSVDQALRRWVAL
jgi:hypothetical protein